jgi:hypothetical protein
MLLYTCDLTPLGKQKSSQFTKLGNEICFTWESVQLATPNSGKMMLDLCVARVLATHLQSSQVQEATAPLVPILLDVPNRAHIKLKQIDSCHSPHICSSKLFIIPFKT